MSLNLQTMITAGLKALKSNALLAYFVNWSLGLFCESIFGAEKRGRDHIHRDWPEEPCNPTKTSVMNLGKKLSSGQQGGRNRQQTSGRVWWKGHYAYAKFNHERGSTDFHSVCINTFENEETFSSMTIFQSDKGQHSTQTEFDKKEKLKRLTALLALFHLWGSNQSNVPCFNQIKVQVYTKVQKTAAPNKPKIALLKWHLRFEQPSCNSFFCSTLKMAL